MHVLSYEILVTFYANEWQGPFLPHQWGGGGGAVGAPFPAVFGLKVPKKLQRIFLMSKVIPLDKLEITSNYK